MRYFNIFEILKLNKMKKFAILLLTNLLVNSGKAQNNIGSYIFPKGILAAHYVSVGTNGNDIDEMRSRIMYIQNENKIKFQRTELFEGTASSYIRRNFIITDSIIYLINQSDGSQSYNFGTNNIYAKIPSEAKPIKWETNEGGTLYRCNAKREKRQYDGKLVDAIIIERLPVENNKEMPDFKTKMIFIYGVGLYQEIMFKTNKLLYRLETIEKM